MKKQSGGKPELETAALRVMLYRAYTPLTTNVICALALLDVSVRTGHLLRTVIATGLYAERGAVWAVLTKLRKEGIVARPVPCRYCLTDVGKITHQMVMRTNLYGSGQSRG